MKKARISKIISLLIVFVVAGSVLFVPVSSAMQPIRIYIDGVELKSDVSPTIINGRTMVPIRAISEGLGMQVEWLENSRSVIITTNSVPGDINSPDNGDAYQVAIMGESVATASELRALAQENNPAAPDLAQLYIRIGHEYGIRGDIAFCQAAKETGWWRYGGLVEADQNNYCGLWATGKSLTGDENLNGADPNRVKLEVGRHGATFDSPATGVEAHIQHLYAYACDKPLPAGKQLVDPRFILVRSTLSTKGAIEYWQGLDGRWAVPGIGYGQSILSDYYQKAFKTNRNNSKSLSKDEQIRELKKQNELLKIENAKMKHKLENK